MFTGVVTNCLSCLSCESSPSLLTAAFPLPPAFKELTAGDSVSADGVCLTASRVLPRERRMIFHIGPETLKITKWRKESFQSGKKFNMEPALRLGARVGGHFVTGAVDGLAEVSAFEAKGASRLLSLKIPAGFERFFWRKSRIAVNGVSLTVNGAARRRLNICLVPVTLAKTNLSLLKKGDSVIFEADLAARQIVEGLEHALKPSVRELKSLVSALRPSSDP